MVTEETMVVALLHDVVEDTNYSMNEISVKGVDHMRKYESQDAIIKDMNIAIKSDLSDNAKETLLHSLSWAFTEFHGKIRGCRYWSEAATAVYRELERKMASASELNKELSRELRHEHVVPRNIFVKSVIEGRKELKIEDLRDKLLGCVVTRAEAETLDKHYKKTHPQGDDFFEIHDAWARYHECGIKYLDSNGKTITALPLRS